MRRYLEGQPLITPRNFQESDGRRLHIRLIMVPYSLLAWTHLLYIESKMDFLVDVWRM